MNTRAQVTVFVIIGLVVLLAMGLVFFFSRVISINNPGYDVPDVSLETRPATTLLTTCLESSAIEGLQLLGASGGKLSAPIVRKPSYRGEAVDFAPYQVAYWRYLDDCNSESGCEFSHKPNLCAADARDCAGFAMGKGSIQEQLETYIEQDIESCVAGFASIADQYQITKTGDASVEVFFVEGQTRILLNYPIEITSLSSDNIQTLESFETDIDVDFLTIYRFANEIISFERETNYYETLTMGLVNAYSGLDQRIPPTDEISLIGSHGPWIQEDVRILVQNDLLPFMSLIRFANSQNNIPITVPPDAYGEYTQYANGFFTQMLPLTSENTYDLEVYHHYLYDDIYLSVDDGSQLIEGSTIFEIQNRYLQLFSQLLPKDYRFEYDISYPLVIEIRQPDALNGEGYSFQFAVEVNVRNNVPAYRNFTTVTFSQDFTRGLGDLRLEQEHTFITTDKHTGLPLEDVVISYVCGHEYAVGITDIFDGKAQTTGQLPYCEYGGYITYARPGYLGESFEFNNRDAGLAQTFSLELWPTQQKQVIVRKRTLADIDEILQAGTQGIFVLDQAYTDLTVNDSVILNVQRQETSPYDTPVPLSGFMKYELPDAVTSTSSQETSDLIEQGYDLGYYTLEERDFLLSSLDATVTPTFNDDVYYMDFVPGTYTFDATLMFLPGFTMQETVIDPDEQSGLFEKLFAPDQEPVTLPYTEFTTWVTGGSAGTFTLPEGAVYTSQPLVFYVIAVPHPDSWEQMINSPSVDFYRESYAGYLSPNIN